mmetsp:Transcript_29200/g.83820  ORF Transcript_29200/g.83820 Transcript_29200/m.83820 type:complete len:390 (+) Transcript_29200:425-1594(+)
MSQAGTSSRNNAKLSRTLDRVQGVLVSELLVLQFSFGGGTNLNTCNTSSKSSNTFSTLITVKVSISTLSFATKLRDSSINFILLLSIGNDSCHLLRNNNTISSTQHIKCDRVKRDSKFLGHERSSSGDCDILRVLSSSVTESRCLDSDHIKDSTHLVNDKSGQSFASDILGNDQKGIFGLDQLFKQGNNIVDIVDLSIRYKNFRVDKLGYLTFLVLNKVRGDVSTIHSQTLSKFNFIEKSLGFLNNGRSSLSNLICSLGDDASHFNGSRSDSGNIPQIIDAFNVLGKLLDFCRDKVGSLSDSTVQSNRAHTSCDSFHTVVNNCLSHNGGSCGTVSSLRVTLRGDFLDQFGSNIFFGVLQADFTGNSDTIVNNFGSTVVTFKNNVPSLGS